MMICNRQPTPFEAGMQPYLPSRHMGGSSGLCDGHHTGAHEWKEAFPGADGAIPGAARRQVHHDQTLDWIGPCRSS